MIAIGSRRSGWALCLLALLASMVLTGCGHPSSNRKPNPAASLTTLGPFAAVSGTFGEQPNLAFPAGSSPSAKLQRKVLHAGNGPKLAIGDLIVTDYLGQIWNGKVFDTSYTSGQAATLQVGLGKLLPGLDAGLVGVPVGSRVELTVPPSDAYGSKGDKAQGISATDTLVFVVDIAKRYNGKSSADPAGSKLAEPAGLPAVGGSLNVAPLIVFGRDVSLPKRRSTYLIARGRGAPLRQGTAVVQYYSVDGKGAFVSSTWLNGTPTSVPIGNATDATGGVFDGLVGVPVGSRVLIVAPSGAAGAPLTKTAVIVVDVLDQVTTAKRMAESS
ncbi:MAG: FKBP-type peptidyl-prolyl cis-trans isomerase [Jatrophihabitantaceae bacterium]